MRLTLPPALEAWIDEHLPGVGGVRSVAIEIVPSLPWPLGPDGLTTGRRIRLRAGAPGIGAAGIDWGHLAAVNLLLHELVHVEQFRPWGGAWWIGYGLFWWAWEPEARARANDLTYRYQQELGL